MELLSVCFSVAKCKCFELFRGVRTYKQNPCHHQGFSSSKLIILLSQLSIYVVNSIVFCFVGVSSSKLMSYAVFSHHQVAAGGSFEAVLKIQTQRIDINRALLQIFEVLLLCSYQGQLKNVYDMVHGQCATHFQRFVCLVCMKTT